MLEWLCSHFKIDSICKISTNKENSPNVTASTKNGTTITTTGNYSPVHIGDIQPKPESNPELTFKNRLIAVANELPHNFQNRGNCQSPFITKALEKLVYEDPLVHNHPELFEKASACLNTATALSTTSP